MTSLTTGRAMRGGHRWAVITAVVGTVLIALGAFWLSFTALADLAMRSGIEASQAWVWPLIVDGIIVVATVSVVALDGQAAAWYAWALLIGGASVSVTANSLHAVVASDPNVPGVLAAAVAAVPPAVLLAITHLTVILIRHATDQPPELRPASTTKTPRVSVPSQVSTRGPQEPGGTARLALQNQPAEEPAPAASAMGAGTPVRQRRTHALELREQGRSNKAIARALGVHPSTVGRWFAREHLSDTTTQQSIEQKPEQRMKEPMP